MHCVLLLWNLQSCLERRFSAVCLSRQFLTILSDMDINLKLFQNSSRTPLAIFKIFLIEINI